MNNKIKFLIVFMPLILSGMFTVLATFNKVDNVSWWLYLVVVFFVIVYVFFTQFVLFLDSKVPQTRSVLLTFSSILGIILAVTGYITYVETILPPSAYYWILIAAGICWTVYIYFMKTRTIAAAGIEKYKDLINKKDKNKNPLE